MGSSDLRDFTGKIMGKKKNKKEYAYLHRVANGSVSRLLVTLGTRRSSVKNFLRVVFRL